MRLLLILLISVLAGEGFGQNSLLAVSIRHLEDVTSDLRVIGVLREVSAQPVGIAVLRKISDGSTLYLKEGATYRGVKIKRVERGRVILGDNLSARQIEPISEAEELANENAEESSNSVDIESKENVAEESWAEIESTVGSKTSNEKPEVSSADDVFELGQSKVEKAPSDQDPEFEP